MRVFLLILLMALAGAGFGQTETTGYLTVEPSELLRTPQRFFARGIVFQDRLEGEADGKKKIDGKAYVSVMTASSGPVYIEKETFNNGGPWTNEAGYVFTGTVLQDTGGLFTRGDYLTVIHALEPAIHAVGTADPAADYDTEFVEQLLLNAQKALSVLAAQRQQKVEDVLTTDPYEEAVRTTVLNALRTWSEEEQRSPESALVILLIRAIQERVAPVLTHPPAEPAAESGDQP